MWCESSVTSSARNARDSPRAPARWLPSITRKQPDSSVHSVSASRTETHSSMKPV